MNRFLKCIGTVLLAGGLSFGCGSLDPRVEKQIELVGSELTDVSVTVDEVKIRLGQGLGEIQGLSVANPDGYVASNAFEMDQLRMNLGIISTLTGEPLVLDELVISHPVVNLEKKSNETSNLKDISENAEKNQDEADRKSAEEEPASEEKPGEPFRIIIRRLVIEGVTLNVRLADGTTRSGTLPSIELTDVGGDDGVTPGGLGVVVIGTMAREMLRQAVARELIDRAGNIRNALDAENILEMLAERLSLTPGQRERIRPAVEKVSEALMTTIDTWVEQGYIDRDTLTGELEPLVEEMEVRVEEVLESEQVQGLRTAVAGLKGDAAEIIRFAVVEMISERLGLTPEQVTQLRPVLREHMVALSDRLHEITAGPEPSFEEFKAAYDEFTRELRHRLSRVLSAEQMRALTSLQNELSERIRTRSFGTAVTKPR